MPRNEDGEMELVLGNKQLLSVLFILVVLLGVFFTMGYVVGRNNPSEVKMRQLAAKERVTASKLPPVTVDPVPGGKPSPTPAAEVPPPPPPAEIREAPAAAKPDTAPKKEEKPKEEGKKDAARKEPETKKEAAKKAEPAPAPAEPSGSTFQAAPNPGQYLQVAAIDRPGATGMAEAYRKQGFAAFITPSSSPTLFRVMIGPFKDNEAVADAKLRLKKIGVDGAILRKF